MALRNKWTSDELAAMKDYAVTHQSTYSPKTVNFWEEFAAMYTRHSANSCKYRYLTDIGSFVPCPNKTMKLNCKSLIPGIQDGLKDIPLYDLTDEEDNSHEENGNSASENVNTDTDVQLAPSNQQQDVTNQQQNVTNQQEDVTMESYTISAQDMNLYKQMFQEIAKYSGGGASEMVQLFKNIKKTIEILYNITGRSELSDPMQRMFDVLLTTDPDNICTGVMKVMEFNILNAHKAMKYYKLKYGKEKLLTPQGEIETTNNNSSYCLNIYTTHRPMSNGPLKEYFKSVLQIVDKIYSVKMKKLMEKPLLMACVEKSILNGLTVTICARRKAGFSLFKNVTLLLPKVVLDSVDIGDVLIFENVKFNTTIVPFNTSMMIPQLILLKSEDYPIEKAFVDLGLQSTEIGGKECIPLYYYSVPFNMETTRIWVTFYNFGDGFTKCETTEEFDVTFELSNATISILSGTIEGNEIITYSSCDAFVLQSSDKFFIYCHGKLTKQKCKIVLKLTDGGKKSFQHEIFFTIKK